MRNWKKSSRQLQVKSQLQQSALQLCQGSLLTHQMYMYSSYMTQGITRLIGVFWENETHNVVKQRELRIYPYLTNVNYNQPSLTHN